MIIASIDPGDSTGIVVYDTLCDTTVSTTATTRTVINVLSAYNFSHPFDIMLIERPPHNSTEPYVAVYRQILTAYLDICAVKTIFPGVWKPFAKANTWKFVCSMTAHEQDAYNMLRFWYLQHKGVDIGNGRKT